MSEETKRKISIANSISHTGKKWSEKQKKAFKNRWIVNKHPMLGKTHSPEARKKISAANSGCNHRDWKGGRIVEGSGYILIYNKQHPRAIHGKYVFEHRLIMEQYLGRYLKPKETVHHINGKRSDNRIENLKLFSNDSEHKKHHFPKGSKFGINAHK